MKSHEYAENLKQTAEYLLARPEFETGNSHICFLFFDKEAFVTAVRSCLPGKKEITADYVTYAPTGIPFLEISAPRRVACRMVQDVKWECYPLLSPEEESQLDVAANK